MKFSFLLLIIIQSIIGSVKGQTLFNELNKNIINNYEIVATIDTINITAEEFFYNYEFGPSFTKLQKDSKEVHLNFMINEKLLALEGLKNGLLKKQEIKNIYNYITADLATEELFKDEILSKVKISDDEINKIVNQKKTDFEIKWIFSTDKNVINNIAELLINEILFDSLFYNQINDSILIDQRSMKISEFNLNKKNPILANIIDTMKVGEVTKPINIEDGWYIIKYENKIIDLLTPKSEIDKLKKEANEALTKFKMDSLSNTYVNEILFKSKPTIKRNGFNILRSYLAKYILSKEIYDEWQLDEKLETALNNLGLSKDDKYPGIVLIVSADKNIDLDDFIYWYKNRELYIKFDKHSLQDFSLSLENLVWQMLRDDLLTEIAKDKKYFEKDWVKQQSQWWKEKIAYSSLRNDYANSIMLEHSEIAQQKNKVNTDAEKMILELSKKLLHKILQLKKEIKVNINKEVLSKINVSSEEDRKAIDFYSIKKGGLIPRPAYPSIDNEWAKWQ